MRSADTVVLTAAQYKALARANRDLASARRRAQVAVAKANIEVAEAEDRALEALTAVAEEAGFDADREWTLQADGTLTAPALGAAKETA